jgi:spore coat polysaccharide biosynthesis predicted glycosyltransferase SpsG
MTGLPPAGEPPLCLILCDGGAGHGLGHLRRSRALALGLKAQGFRVRLECLNPALAAQTAGAPTAAGKPGIVVIDIPGDGEALRRRWKAAGAFVVGLDYLGPEPPDLLIALHPQPGMPLRGRHLIGLEFAIIREEIRAARDAAPGAGRGALVMIGGGDLRRQGEAAARRLAERGEQVTLIEGPLSAAAAPGGDSGAIARLRDPADLAARMAGCAWAVSNGGTTMMELMCLGKAAHVLPQTDAEARFARSVLDRNGILGLGLDVLRPPIDAERRQTGALAAQLVDGRGIERIAAAVRELAAAGN